MTDSPADRCPYSRPFPEDFDDCAAYQPNRFVALDSGYRPMPVVWTCSWLEPAAAPQRNRFYGRCRIGDAAARQAWVNAQPAGRLAAIRALSAELDPLMAEQTTALWVEKAAQLRSDSGTAEWREATARLRERAAHFMVTLDAYMEERSDQYLALGFPREPFMRLLEDLVERWIEQPNTEVPEIPDSALEQFPPDTRVFIKPDYVDASAG